MIKNYKLLIKYFFIPINILYISVEILLYKFFKKPPAKFTIKSLIIFFTLFGRSSIDFINRFVLIKKKIKTQHYEVLRKYDQNDLIKFEYNKEDFKFFVKNGYFYKENCIDEKNLKVLVSKLKQIHGEYLGDNYKSANKELLDLDNPKSVKYLYREQDLINCKYFQTIILNYNILKFSEEYLNSLPIIDILHAWWSFPTSQPDSEAAQFWHFDMDRTKWIKVFVFLKDCKLSNGPHEFLSQSHSSAGFPKHLRKKGYMRLSDEDLKKDKQIDTNRFKCFTAKAGSVLFEDTMGLHKGRRVEKDNRLVFQIQYSSSLFGSNNNSSFKKNVLPKQRTKTFDFLYENYKEIFMRFK